MATTTLNISLPGAMRRFVEDKIANDDYGTISEYIRDLIRADQRAENSKLEALIAEAYASGEASPLTKADVDEARRIIKKRIAARKAGK